MAELTPIERDVLRHLNGDDEPDAVWREGFSAAATSLYARGLVIRAMVGGVMKYQIRDAGRAALAKGDQS